MTIVAVLSSRRALLSGAAASIAAGILGTSPRVVVAQTDRALLDMLFVLEQIQVVHFAAMLDAFDEADFAAAGFPEGTRKGIEKILADDSTHLARLARPEGNPLPPPISPAFTSLQQAMRDAVVLKNLSGAAYAGVIATIGRPGIVPDLIGSHAVEARHVAWLLGLLGEDPFPNAIDPSLAPSEVLSRLGELAQATPPAATPVADADMVAPLLVAIAKELGVETKDLQVVSIEPREWPDASLGCPQPGHAYADVITPGYVIVVEAAGSQLEFHTDEQSNLTRCP